MRLLTVWCGEHNWTKEGVRDLKHVGEKIRTHEKWTKNINNIVSFQILASLNSVRVENCRKRNEMVKKPYGLSKTIKILKLCGEYNLALGAPIGRCLLMLTFELKKKLKCWILWGKRPLWLYQCVWWMVSSFQLLNWLSLFRYRLGHFRWVWMESTF